MSKSRLALMAAMMQGGSVDLPYDAQVEYLRSDGNAFINTGIHDIDALEIKFRYGVYWEYYALFGNYYNEDANTWRLIMSSTSSSGNLLAYANSKASAGNTNIPIAVTGVDHTLYLSKTSIVYDGTTFTGTINTTTGNSNTTPIAIFVRSVTSPLGYNVYMRCYYFKAWKNGNLVIDLIPVRIGTTGYMYDNVSGQLLGNAGTGSFILGDDITT